MRRSFTKLAIALSAPLALLVLPLLVRLLAAQFPSADPKPPTHTVTGLGPTDITAARSAPARIISAFPAIADPLHRVSDVHRWVGYGRLPLSFEANQGQADPRVKFLAHGQGYELFLASSETTLVLQSRVAEASFPDTNRGSELSSHLTSSGSLTQRNSKDRGLRGVAGQLEPRRSYAVRMRFAGANQNAKVRGLNELSGKVSYFVGNDPNKWIRKAPTYGQVLYGDIYPGIDLLYHGNQQRLETDFLIAPGANPAQIHLQFEGGNRLQVLQTGDLLLKTPAGELRLQKPRAYQEIAGTQHYVAADYVVRDATTVGFSLGNYDHSAQVVIDPVLVYSTALNGANFAVGNGGGHGVAVDAAGNAYVTGGANSNAFLPTPGAFSTPSEHVFVAKLNPSGGALVYLSVFGGSSSDVAYAIAVDGQGEAVITGNTTSADFPTRNAQQAALAAGTHAFVTKLNAAGSDLAYSTYLGGNGAQGTGNGDDVGQAVTTDANGAIYVTGWTNSVDFPVKNGVQPTCPDLQTNGYCNTEGFVTKLDPTQSGAASLVYSTYLGGNFPTFGQGIAVDAPGNAYVVGSTNATDFPTTPGAYQANIVGGTDAFVSVLKPGGNAFVYSTYLGYGFGWAVAVDTQGNAYVTGATNAFGGNFPTTPGAFQTSLSGSTTSDHAFVTKLNPTGTGLVYSTFLGGSGIENSNTGNIAIDGSGNAYISGFTSSTDFPTTANAVQTTFGGGSYDAFLTQLNATGSGLVFSTYLGGVGNDQAYGIALDAATSIYVMGYTGSSNFPTTAGAYETAVNTGNTSLFVAKIAAGGVATHFTVSAPASATAGTAFNFTVTAEDASGNPATSYIGAVHFTSSDGQAFLPADYTFVPGDNGTHLFSATLQTPGSQTLTATDTANAAIGGTSSGVTVAPAVATHFSVSAPGSTTAGMALNITVTALSASNNTATGYTGTVHFTSTDPQAVLPADYTFTVADNGAHVISVTLNVAGSQMITATDTANGTVTGTSGAIVVSAPPPPAQIIDNETISVTDAESFQDVFDAEAVHVTDTAFVTPLINVAAPVAGYSAGSLGFGNVPAGQTGAQSLTVSDIGQAPLLLSSAALSPGSAFSIAQIMCSNGATSLPTTLPVGGACTFMVSYLTPAGAAAGDTLTFTDNAALSNVATAQAGSSYTQSIPLNGSGTTTPPPPPPPAVIPVTDNETITVADAVSFQDVLDAEVVHVTDTAFVTPLINVAAPVADYSAGSLGFGNVPTGQTGTQSLTVSDIGQAPLLVSSVALSPGSAFSLVQIACSNGATSLPTTLPVGGACTFMVSYLAPAGAAASDTLTFTDNAALSNVATAQAGSSYTQSIPLNGSGTTTPPPPPPPAVIPVTDNETITVADVVSFQDVVDAEAVHVADAVFVAPLINVTAPVAEFSAGTLGFSGQSGSQTITASDIGTASLTLASATISGSSQFAITQIVCSNGATSASTTLPSGGACILAIGYSASATPANDNGTLVFTDNAALSNLASIPAGSSFTQSIPLSGAGTTTGPPPPPPAVVPVMDNETIHVTDVASFPDVFDSETITVTDQVSVTILSNPTTISITAPGVTYGTAANATVSVNSSGGTVTGNVTISVDSVTTLSMALSGGSAIFNLGVLSGGNHTLVATFAAQGSFGASNATTTITIAQATPTVTFTGAPASANYQSMFTVAATTNATTTATITASGACSIAGTTVTMTSGTGACNLTANWSADANYLAASAVQGTTATKIAATTTFTGAPASAAYKSSFTVVATTNASTTAIVTASGACSISGATVTISSGTGTCTLAANWASDNNYFAASATQSTMTTKIAPTVTFTGAPASAVYQSSFTVTATTNASTVATITAIGACSIAGNTVTMTSGTGTCSLTASWASDNNYLAASATQSTAAVKANAISVITSHMPNPSVVGQVVTVTFTVSPVAPATSAPTGNVTVSDGTGDSCTATVASRGCSVSITSAGPKTLTAAYGGDNNFAGSTSAGASQTVNKGNTTIKITAHSPTSSVAGQPVTISFAVAVAAPASGTVSGSVTLSDNVGDTCTAPVSSGTCSMIFAAAGTKTVTASYGGDNNFNPSTSSSVTTVTDFMISAKPSSQIIKAGQKAGYNTTLAPLNAFVGTVSVSCGGAPPGATCTVSPNSATLNGSMAMTLSISVQTSRSTPKGNYTVTLKGIFGSGAPASGGLTHTASFVLTLQ